MGTGRMSIPAAWTSASASGVQEAVSGGNRLPVRSGPDTMIFVATTEPSVVEAFDEALRAGDEDLRWELISHLHLHGG